MRKYIVLLFLIISTFCCGQINTAKGNCEIIKIDGIKSFPNSNDLVFYYYSLNGTNWTLFDRNQDEYRQGLVFTVEEDIIGFLSPDGDVSAYVGPLYIKGEELTNVGAFPDPYFLVADCEKQIMLTPPNKPIPCDYRRIGIPIEYYYIIPCSPHLVGIPVTNKSTCFENHDAKATFTFDRDLLDNEYFLLNLITVTNNGISIPPQVKYVYKEDYLNREIIFTNLDSGTFYLHYQTFQVGNSTPFSDNNSDQFTIEPIEPLTFKIKADNPACYNGKVDITIEADSGTPPYYYDDLNWITEMDNGISQIKRIRFDPSDINKKTVTIQQVELKEYNIKVTDANKCIEH